MAPGPHLPGAEGSKIKIGRGQAGTGPTGSSERSVEAAKAALPGIEVLVSDAGNVAATKVLVDQVTTKHGRIDVLFVNAGIAKFAPIAQSTKPFTTAISTSTSRAHTS